MRGVNLSIKLTICLIGGMVLVFSALGYRIIKVHRENLEEATYAAGDRIVDVIKRSTRYSMLHNQSDEIHQIITAIGSQPGIEKIRIFNKAGEIKCSTDSREILTKVDKSAEGCYACHAPAGASLESAVTTPHQLTRAERTRIYSNGNGERILSVINPIDNEAGCSTAACHAHSLDTKILGMINVRMSLAPVDGAIAKSRRQMVTLLAVAILTLSALVAALIRIMIHRRVRSLIIGTNRVAAGDLDYKLNVSSRDEVGELAQSFNRMTFELKQANAEINDWTRSLESRVEQSTAELRRAHDHILQVEKLASIGKLAAIVAHEINNPLAGILVYAKSLLKRMQKSASSDDPETRRILETIAGESARCGEIVKGLLQFSRQTKPNMAPNDLNEIISQSVRLVRHKTDLMNANTELLLDNRIKQVVCDAQQIKQALVALLINACEAMPPGGGQLTVESRHLPDCQTAEIRISDNGVGMDAETKKHIFEPFFTTKEQGKGVGLGLAVVYGIVLGHCGDIEVESAPGEGTTFTIKLPEEALSGDAAHAANVEAHYGTAILEQH
ncbi:MAG TPA: ATP-binding protein [Blastocatellia bacterium]|nr:ATP-binding protein [Blastocatellia bacterium]